MMTERLADGDNHTNQLLNEDLRTIDLGINVLTIESAIECLRGDVDVVLPIPKAKPCNNLDEYFLKSTSNSQKNLSKKTEPFAVPLVRNFDKILKKPSTDGEKDLGFIHRSKKKKDVFSKSTSIELSSGRPPVLAQRLNQVVKVLIRRRRKVPYISRVIEYTGTLVMFDKHMNLYLQDVVESFTYSSGDNLLKRARFRENILVRGDNIILIQSNY